MIMMMPHPTQLRVTGLSVSQEELTYRPVDLYAHDTAEKRRKVGLNAAEARKGFQSGRVFYTKSGSPLSVFDLPARKPVIIHCSGGLRLKLKVPLNIGVA